MILLILGCLQSSQEAKNVQIDGAPLTERIAQIEEHTRKHEQEMAEDFLVLMRRMKKIEGRVKTIEITLTDVRPQIFAANEISFIPTATKLSATDVQKAMEQIEARLHLMEQSLQQDTAQPGSGLFELRNHGKKGKNKTDKGNPKHGPSNGQGGQGGQGGGQGGQGGQGGGQGGEGGQGGGQGGQGGGQGGEGGQGGGQGGEGGQGEGGGEGGQGKPPP